MVTGTHLVFTFDFYLFIFTLPDGRCASQSLYLSAMSTASKATLLGTILGTAGIVVFVHWAQTAEKAVRFLPCSSNDYFPSSSPST